jgi:hypothetical protein
MQQGNFEYGTNSRHMAVQRSVCIDRIVRRIKKVQGDSRAATVLAWTQGKAPITVIRESLDVRRGVPGRTTVRPAYDRPG